MKVGNFLLFCISKVARERQLAEHETNAKHDDKKDFLDSQVSDLSLGWKLTESPQQN